MSAANVTVRREEDEQSFDDFIRAMVDEAPPLTPEQRIGLAMLLSPVRVRVLSPRRAAAVRTRRRDAA